MKDMQDKLQDHHKQTLWIYWVIFGFGFWLLISPFSLGYLNELTWVNPSGGRGVWFSDRVHTELRAWLMTVSDMFSGILLLIFGWRGLKPNRPVSLWICCGVGAWLNFAPLLFWSPVSVAYLNDTLVGAALIALTILIPGMPNMMKFMKMGGDMPPGWSYNPSSWPQRWIMIVTGFLGWMVSRYIASYQLGYTNYIWDPFFGFNGGTRKVLDSAMSHAWPISDGGLGALAYTFEFLMGWMGSPSRWRTMPWMVAFFGILVIPLGLTHIFLVISQPVTVGAWCTMCLLAAVIMLPMIPLEVDEVFAMIQHLREAKKRGDRDGSLWTLFWKGGSAEGLSHDERSPQMMQFATRPGEVFRSSIWGMSFPWTLTVSVLLGGWIMFSPLMFGGSRDLSNILHLGGALAITVAVISMGEIIRSGRYLNVLIGAIVAVGPWIMANPKAIQGINAIMSGLVLMILSIPRGVIKENFGPLQKWIH